jgi:hypothetical protein
MIFEVSVVNAYLIYKDYKDTSGMTMLQFCESLVRSLLLGVPFGDLKPRPTERSTSRTKHKLANHKLEEMEGSARDQSREASDVAAKKIKTFCSDCNKFFVLIVLTRNIRLCNK